MTKFIRQGYTIRLRPGLKMHACVSMRLYTPNQYVVICTPVNSKKNKEELMALAKETLKSLFK